jgi:hypothetical protein
VEQGARRITSENGVLFQMIQLGALQDPLFRVYGPPMTFIEIGKDLHQDALKRPLINSRALSLHLRERERGRARFSVYDLRNDEETAATARRPESKQSILS